ncbi:uncharacterized protein LOC107689679 [Sinocyclocheilus anshuiensis]|uniref:uncharacterized protein LOC107689679 n=1 Tax=Sinocyclocheilus anshuiensis TaxID=1608454 RepID=UPI0007B8A257|nr:PREDICTED: uncharacterized protein LOC107689679 [Sinocyclocheilus anshuiensis]
MAVICMKAVFAVCWNVFVGRGSNAMGLAEAESQCCPAQAEATSEDFHYIQRLEGESVDIDCVAQASKPRPALLHLRRRFAPSESVLNVSEDNVMRADPEIEGRISISGQLKLRTVTLTLSHLRATDSGLYVCDFSGNPSDPLPASTALFLLVKAPGELCSCRRYSLLIYTITVGVNLLLLSAIALFVTHYKKPHAQPERQTTVPIYEDMSSVKGKGSSPRICPPDPETSAPGWKTMLENLYGSPNRTNVEQHQEKESS